MLGECRRDVEAMTHIDAYFKAHPKAPRPESCSLPLRSGFIAECQVETEAANTRADHAKETARQTADDTAKGYKTTRFVDFLLDYNSLPDNSKVPITEYYEKAGACGEVAPVL